MMRTGFPRALLRSLNKTSSANTRLVHNIAQLQARTAFRPSVSSSAKPLALTAFRAANTALIRSYASQSTSGSVATGSDQQQALANKSAMVEEEEEKDVDMMAGIRHDIVRP